MSVENVPTSVIVDGAEATPAQNVTPNEVDQETTVTLDDPVRVIQTSSCFSLTARSTLSYELGIKGDSELYLRLISNTASGFFSKEWTPCAVIEQMIAGSSELTSTSFKKLFPNKSVNTGGFVMAVVKALGLIRTNEENTRWHEQVPERTFEDVAREAMEQPSPAKKEVEGKGIGKRRVKDV